jgi:hypothetical protein
MGRSTSLATSCAWRTRGLNLRGMSRLIMV